MRKLIILPIVALLLLWSMAFAQTPAPQSSANVQITQGPKVENVTSNSAVIAWSTNVQGSTVLKYGTDKNNLNQTAEAPWGGTTHRVTIPNLKPNTSYYFDVETGQAQGTGTAAISGTQSFKTKPAGQ